MSDEIVINFAETEVSGFSPLGEAFSEARNAKKLTLKDVSNNLRLSVKQIEALENNNFSHLPPAMITRGFIRNYARFLELDAEPLLASYRARMPDASPGTLIVKTSMNQVMPGKEKPSLSRSVLLTGLILLCVAAGLYYDNYMQKTAQQVTKEIVSPAMGVLPEPAHLPELALPAAERLAQADVAETAVVSAPVATDGDLKKETLNQTTPSTTALPKVAQVLPLPAGSPDVATQNIQLPKESTVDSNAFKGNATKAAQSLTAAGVVNSSAIPANPPELAKSGLKPDNSIAVIKGVNIAVTEQTWVRVTDKSGAVVYEKMLSANSEDGFNGSPPLKVLIGNAKATKLTFLGQNVDLSDKTKNNVARLTLE